MTRRRGLPLALITVATLVAFLAIFAVWANRQLLNTDNWTNTSTELLEDDAIREQISLFLVDELYANVDVQAEVAQALPPRAAPLAGAAAGGLRTLAERGVDQLLTRPRAQALWEQSNRRAHRRFLQIVEGGGEVVSTTNGDIVLDLKSLLNATEERVGVGGRVAAKVPADAAQLTILKSDELDLAQDMVDLLKSLALWLVVLALGLYALAVGLARGWRRKALRAVGAGLFFAGALALLARSFAGNALVDSLAATDSAKPAVEATWSIGTSRLQEAAAATLAYGVVIFLAAWLAGPTRAAVGTRGALAPYLREPRVAYGAFAIVVVLILAWGPTPALRKPGTALILIVLLALGLETLRRQTAREFPDASLEDAAERMRKRFSGIGARVGGAPPDQEGDRLSRLERIGRLHDSGVLDDAEFEREKKRLVSQQSPG